MMSILDECLRDQAEQFMLDRQGCLARGQARAVGDSKDMGIHRQGGMTKSGVEDHIGGFAPHARQGFQGDPVRWNFPAMTLQQEGTGCDDTGGLGVVETQCPDVGFKTLLTQIQHGLGRIGHREKARRRLVDALVCGLGGENNRHQELEGAGIVQLRPGCGIARTQALEDKSAFLLVHGPFGRPFVFGLSLNITWGQFLGEDYRPSLMVKDTTGVSHADEEIAVARRPGIPPWRPA